MLAVSEVPTRSSASPSVQVRVRVRVRVQRSGELTRVLDSSLCEPGPAPSMPRGSPRKEQTHDPALRPQRPVHVRKETLAGPPGPLPTVRAPGLVVSSPKTPDPRIEEDDDAPLANRFRRGLYFLVPGLGVGLVLVFTLSVTRVFVPSASHWIPLVVISGVIFFGHRLLHAGQHRGHRGQQHVQPSGGEPMSRQLE